MLACWTVLLPLSVHAQSLLGPEYQVKAAFIYNFAKFVEFPRGTFDNATDPIVFCIVPDDPATDVFNALEGKTVGGRKIIVRKYAVPKDTEGCHIVFCATQNSRLVQDLLDALNGRSVLTVGETEGFTRRGGIINFFAERERLRFKVNPAAAKRAGLKLGSQVLMSAEIIKEEQK